jgi:CheY-like chemotaxis protein
VGVDQNSGCCFTEDFYRRRIVIELEEVLPFNLLRGIMNSEGNVTSSKFFSMNEVPPILSSVDTYPSAGQRVLIFSRDYDTCLLLKTLLEMWGYEIDLSDSLEKSLAIIEAQKPHLILLDSVLPFESHLENIRQIRRRETGQQTPIVVISGFSQPRFQNLSMEVGADGFLVKPLDFDLLEVYLRLNIEKNNDHQN